MFEVGEWEAFTAEPESLSVGQLNAVVRFLREQRHQDALNTQALQADLATVTQQRDQLQADEDRDLGKASAFDEVTAALKPHLTDNKHWVTAVKALERRATTAEDERDASARRASIRQMDCDRVVRERDQLAAQVAALVDGLRNLTEAGENVARFGDSFNGVLTAAHTAGVYALANIPAAAARYLAADRLAKAYTAWCKNKNGTALELMNAYANYSELTDDQTKDRT